MRHQINNATVSFTTPPANVTAADLLPSGILDLITCPTCKSPQPSEFVQNKVRLDLQPTRICDDCLAEYLTQIRAGRQLLD